MGTVRTIIAWRNPFGMGLVLPAVLFLLFSTAGLFAQELPHGADPASDPEPVLPRVHVLATGGTISNTEGDRLTGDDLVRGLPEAGTLARFTVEQFSNVASGAITLTQWMEMASRIHELFTGDDPPVGVIVTHGTDTMEETAYFLDLTLAQCRPVVVTGAMRRASMAGADGPANLLNAVRLAVHGEADRLGAVVLMNDEIFPAREVVKVHTSRMNAFEAPGVGPLGVADPDSVVLRSHLAAGECGTAAFDLEGVHELPRVEIVHAHLGADGTLIRAAVAAGAQGIVLASVGRGGATPDQSAAIREAREAGVVVVRSSRTGAGRVPVGSGMRDDLPGAILGAGDLTPQKARILLMLALTTTSDADQLREIFLRL
ncbi:MAG: asparaginase [Gemmatimonadales bacterium]|nr:MAG: asparaginase [Gemmatimonadales bacterium]